MRSIQFNHTITIKSSSLNNRYNLYSISTNRSFCRFQVIFALFLVAATASAYPLTWAAYGGAPLGADGRVIDTPEVAQAKVIHYAALNEAASRAAHGSWAGVGLNHGAWAYGAAPLGPDGRVIDTPEVAQAKAAHYAAKAAAAHGAYLW